MKLITRIAIAAAIACIATVSTGSIKEASADACAGYRCNDTQIKRLYPTAHTDGRVYIQPKDGGQNNLTCTPLEGSYLVLKKNHPLFEETYKTLLAAMLAKAEVSFRLNNDGGPCRIIYITMADE